MKKVEEKALIFSTFTSVLLSFAVVIGAVALIKNGPADEQENAKKFIDWICSVDGQGSYAENDSFRVPTNTQAPVADGLVTLDQVPVIDYDAVWASNNKSKYCEEFEEKIVAKPES